MVSRTDNQNLLRVQHFLRKDNNSDFFVKAHPTKTFAERCGTNSGDYIRNWVLYFLMAKWCVNINVRNEKTTRYFWRWHYRFNGSGLLLNLVLKMYSYRHHYRNISISLLELKFGCEYTDGGQTFRQTPTDPLDGLSQYMKSPKMDEIPNCYFMLGVHS